MGSLYRSEPMVLSQLFLQPDSAYNCLAELGEVGLVQFQDLNKDVNTFQRNYVREIRRCEEMERRIRFLENEMHKDDIKVDNDGGNPAAPTSREIGDVEAELERLESELKEVNSNYDTMKRSFVDLTEVSHILSKAGNFFNERPGDQVMITTDAAVAGVGPASNLGFTAGVILRDRIPSFERMLWRACRGNVLLRHMEIDQPLDNMASETDQHKSVFLVFYQGEQLKIKVKKICEGFHATVYPCPEKQSERDEMRKGVATRIEDIKTVLNQTKEHRLGVLYKAATKLHYWAVKVRKMKAIYHTMNMFSGGSNSVGSSGTRGVGETTQPAPKSLLGVCWCPVRHLEAIRHALQLGVERSGTGSAYILNLVETNESPPTYHETNKFTSVFQSVIDSYGIATYQEVNPAPFSIISFPFLFSVMFGDAGHGLLVTLAALAMVILERRLLAQKSTNEIWNIFFGGRYIILLMGFFSIYSGLLYNDIFAKAFNIFGSAWYPSPAAHPPSQLETSASITLNPAHNIDYVGVPYPFGMDPIWSMSKNAISFLNSFKMKISVIFGISQMLFGVVLSLMNHIYNGDVISICCEFIPQVIFLLCIFGYLIILIFYKWIVYNAATSGCAPSLLIDLINMFLLNYPPSPCSVLTFYEGQRSFQTFLLLMVVICIPWLLIPKPLILRHLHKKKQLIKVTDTTSLISPSENIEMNSGDSSPPQARSSSDVILQGEGLYETVNSVSEDKKPKASNSAGHSGGGHGHGGHDEFDFGDVFVHQCIHTIEYCLGCISHTASYLRLWALSLAHAELSEVLWNMVMHTAFTLLGGYAGCIVVFVIFAPWAVLTVAILMLMEGLSAFLHTLRLHWVEFQSKFYKGEGYEFNPYSFKRCLDPNSEDEKSE